MSRTKASTKKLGEAARAVARRIVALPPAARATMLAGLEASINPLDRTIAAEARRMLAPAPRARTI